MIVIPLGLVWAALYFIVFTLAIKFFNLKTPAREDEVMDTIKSSMDLKTHSKNNNKTSLGYESVDKNTNNHNKSSAEIMAEKLIIAYGGIENIANLDVFISRLRIIVKDKAKVDQQALKELGAKGVLVVGNVIQAIFGTLSENYRGQMQKYINSQKK